MTPRLYAVPGIRLRRQQARTTHSVDELVGGGSVFDCRTMRTRPTMPLLSGVKRGLRDELHRLIEEDLDTCTIALFEKMKLRAEGSDDSLIYHAVRSEGGTPWYDSVLYMVSEGVDEDEDGEEKSAERTYFCAGRLMIFVRIDFLDGSNQMMALVHAYRCPQLAADRSHIYDVSDPAALAASIATL